MLVAVALTAPLAAAAAESPPKPKAAVPADFLEYLAGLEGPEDNWTDFEVADPAPAAGPKKAAPKAAKAAEAK